MDVRIQRTRTALQAALLELCRERAFDDITVGDICERAGVNRSSYYKHYPDRETLAADSLEAEINDLATALIPDDSAKLVDEGPQLLTAYLQHVATNAHVYRALFGQRTTGVIGSRLGQHLGTLINAMGFPDQPDDPDGLPVFMLASGIAGATLGMIGAWITQEEPAPVETAAGWIWTMLAPHRHTPVRR